MTRFSRQSGCTRSRLDTSVSRRTLTAIAVRRLPLSPPFYKRSVSADLFSFPYGGDTNSSLARHSPCAVTMHARMHLSKTLGKMRSAMRIYRDIEQIVFGGLCSGKIDLFFLSRFSCAAFQILFHVRNSVRRPVQGRISVALPLPDFISAERRSHTAKSAAFCGRTLLCILLFTRLFLSYRFQRRRL